MGSLESDTTERLHFHFSLSCIGEGNGNQLQCSCLENPRDGEAWWAAVYGVAQKRLSSSSSTPTMGYPGGSVVKNPPTNAGDSGWILGLGRSPGEGNGNPLQCSCLENPMDRGAWWAIVHGVVRDRTRLSDFTFTSHFHALEKEMATHSSVLAWRIPGTGEPGGLPSVGSHRVGHN